MSSPVPRYHRSVALGAPAAGQGMNTPTVLEKVICSKELFTKYRLVPASSKQAVEREKSYVNERI